MSALAAAARHQADRDDGLAFLAVLARAMREKHGAGWKELVAAGLIRGTSPLVLEAALAVPTAEVPAA